MLLMLKNKQTYLNNPNLPTVNAEFEYTPEMIVDLEKSSKNILYFAENHFHIISLDEGKQKIELHLCQKRVLRKMRDNRFFILLASRQIGKALALDTKIPTPSGWTTMGDIKQGDEVYGIDGKPCNVVYVHDILENRDCYKLTFDNGQEIVADAEHLWFTETKQERKTNGSVKTTQQIFETLNYGDEPNHRIPSCIDGVEGIKKDLPRAQWHYIKNVEKVESVPVRCITVDSPDSLYLVGDHYIPTHNTTLMTIYALWVACFQKDQSILIVANKEGTAIEIFRRIRLAYEELPNWLKPGVKEYGKTSMILGNGCRIGISTTTGTAARGQSINCLILDELAFIEPHLVDEFWKSVYPIVSSSKKSKIFIASTANGTGNLFHNLYSGAETGRNGWCSDKILWNEIPGRDEKWKNETIATIGSLDAFNQEFNCEFLDSGESSVNEELYERLKVYVTDPKFVMEDGHYTIWEEPKDSSIYIAGVDISEGVDKDASVIQILDITDLTSIKQVAIYHNNGISPYPFTEKLNDILTQWGKPLVAIERNNCGAQVVDNLREIHGYDNIVSWGAAAAGRTKSQLGIIAHTNTKFTGVTNMRYWVNQLEVVQIKDLATLKEMRDFVRSANGSWGAKKGAGYHDDRVMALVWALIILDEALVSKHFDVVKTDSNNRPLILKQIDFGIKYYTSTSSFYNQKDNNSAMPSIIGNASGEIPDDDLYFLQQQGFRPLQ